jgi:selenide,water dikinase
LDLEGLLEGLSAGKVSGLEVGPGDDAGVFRLSNEVSLIETVDIITPLVDDPYIFGKIASANALSDIYAMGGTPKTALIILAYEPCESSPEEIKTILKGVADTLDSAGVALTGGHTLEDIELKVGLSVTGVASRQRVLLSKGATPGDVLVLTKPLGTGILTTALKGGKLTMAEMQEAIEWMTTLNDRASKAAIEAGATACTDVTGFGLLGHAYNMVKGSSLELIIESTQVPFMDRVVENASMGIIPEVAYKNYEFLKDKVRFSNLVNETLRLLLCDPQTSGGLLIAINREGLEVLEENAIVFHVIGQFRKGQGSITVI